MKKTKIIAGFPGTGKTTCYIYKKEQSLSMLDSDSSTFSKEYFPDNYIQHIKDNMGLVDIIFVSTHREVRDALLDNGIDFYLVYPDRSLKNEYLKRYEKRGSSSTFISLMKNMWDVFIDDVESQKNATLIKLLAGKFVSDIIQTL